MNKNGAEFEPRALLDQTSLKMAWTRSWKYIKQNVRSINKHSEVKLREEIRVLQVRKYFPPWERRVRDSGALFSFFLFFSSCMSCWRSFYLEEDSVVLLTLLSFTSLLAKRRRRLSLLLAIRSPHRHSPIRNETLFGISKLHVVSYSVTL